jgi:hypothetical protein
MISENAQVRVTNIHVRIENSAEISDDKNDTSYALGLTLEALGTSTVDNAGNSIVFDRSKNVGIPLKKRLYLSNLGVYYMPNEIE